MEHLLVPPAYRLALYYGRGLIPILVSLASVTVGIVYAVTIFGVITPPPLSPRLAVSVDAHGVRDGRVRTATRGRCAVPLHPDHPGTSSSSSGCGCGRQLSRSQPPSGPALDRRRVSPDLGPRGGSGPAICGEAQDPSCLSSGGRSPSRESSPWASPWGVGRDLLVTGPGHREHRPFLKSRRGAFTGGAEARPTDVVRRRRIDNRAEGPLCPEGAIFGRSP